MDFARVGKELYFLDGAGDVWLEDSGADDYENMAGFEKALYWIPAGLDQFDSGIKQLFSEEALPTSAT